MNKQEAFNAVLKTLKNDHIMVDTREDGIYIRFAGKSSDGEFFSKEFVKVMSFDQPSRTSAYAEHELDILCKTVEDPIIKPFRKEIVALCDAFGRSGQSGGSAPYTAGALSQAIKKLCLQEPICPITGIREEWTDISGMNDGKTMYQNNRCGAVFKDGENGRPYYLDAIIWKDQRGHGWCGSAYLKNRQKLRSRQYIKKFPFEPKTFYIDIIAEEIAKDDWIHWVKNEKQLKAVFKYYDMFEEDKIPGQILK